MLNIDTNFTMDCNDSNYNSTHEDDEFLTPRRTSEALAEYKRKVVVIIEEYFINGDVISTANELTDVAMPNYDYYFVKKLVSMAMDRHDKEKEMAAVLLSSLYADVINPAQVYKGFSKLVESVDDFAVDIPDVVDVLSVFIARAIVDDILPPVFLKQALEKLSNESKGVEVLKRTEKCYLSARHHSEVIENKWGGNRQKTVEDVKGRIGNLLREYVESGDKIEACRCIKELNVPFFHHEIVKQALIMAMETKRGGNECKILKLLRMAAEENLINSSQITKGFNRLIDIIDDLSLDIPNARQILRSLISKCASEGWLSASSLKSFSLEAKGVLIREDVAKSFKAKIDAIIREYFLSGDTIEVYNCLVSDNFRSSSELNAVFVKRLINLAMDRKNREKEMASVLLSSLCLPPMDVANGFISLIETADDIALDNPTIVEDLAKFISRAIVDEVIAPSHLEDIGAPFIGTNYSSIGHDIIRMASSILRAPLFGERILRCWGSGWASVEDVKDKITKLLEEYECGGDIKEACRCIKELGMPFFNHEVVKKALVIVMEKRNERLWRLLEECMSSGLITVYQMTKGFERVKECLDDLTLDVPDVRQQFFVCFTKASSLGWLDPLYCSSFTSLHVVEDDDFHNNQPKLQ